ncbi:unnamed protein product, partial [Mesorhabditis belari]|uniref:Kinesin-like protein n=1 Tax=Mesorhabditis belari TaxID=2138241 RepID=A0AAF3EYY6_9BILA
MGKKRVDNALEVVCRIVPYNGSDPCLTVEDETTLVAIAPETTKKQGVRPESRTFKFSHVFDETDDQRKIFDRSAMDLMENILQGKNSLLFTYGVTGGGKTYTMTGNTKAVGILPRCLDVLFNSIKNNAEKFIFQTNGRNGYVIANQMEATLARKAAERGKIDYSTEISNGRQVDGRQVSGFSDDYTGAVFVSYVEVYNNYVYDLLDDSIGTPIARDTRVDIANSVYVDGVSEFEVETADEALELLARGDQRRRISDTLLNKSSSRSHSVFTIRLVQAPFESDLADYPTTDQRQLVVSQLSLVDLAGSERAKRTRNTGAKLAEAGQINNSLLTLRQCFEKLRYNQRRRGKENLQVVPYRNSKLTTLFKNFFEGTGKVRMILCMNPRPDDYQENLSVLEFGEESRAICTRVGENVIANLASTRPPVPKRFFLRWNQEADRNDNSSQMSIFPSGEQMPPEAGDNEEMSAHFSRLRNWAEQRQNLQASLLQNMKESAVLFEPKLRAALCLLDYRNYELEELKIQKLEDESALARVQAQLKQANRELLSLRGRLKIYEEEDARAITAEEQQRLKNKSEHEKLKETQRALRKINEVCESTTRSPSVAQLKSTFNQMATSTKQIASPVRRARDETEKGGAGFYDPRYQRRSKSAPRMLVHQPLNRIPTGNILRAKVPPNAMTTTAPQTNALKKSTDYVLTHQMVDKVGNISTSIVKGHVIPTAGGGSAVCFENVEKLTHEKLTNRANGN